MDTITFLVSFVTALIATVAIIIIVSSRGDEVRQLTNDNALLRRENKWYVRKIEWLESELGRSDEPQRERKQ